MRKYEKKQIVVERNETMVMYLQSFCQSSISPHLILALPNKPALLKAQTVQTAATPHLAETRTVTQNDTKVPNSPLVPFGVVIRLQVEQVSHKPGILLEDLHLHLFQTNFHLSLSVVAPNLWLNALDAKVSGFNPNTFKTHALRSIDVLLMWVLLINLFKCVSCGL